MVIVFIALANMAVVSDSIVSDESIAFVLSKLKLGNIILSRHQRDAICTIPNSWDVVVCLPTGYGSVLVSNSYPGATSSSTAYWMKSEILFFSVAIVSLLVS